MYATFRASRTWMVHEVPVDLSNDPVVIVAQWDHVNNTGWGTFCFSIHLQDDDWTNIHVVAKKHGQQDAIEESAGEENAVGGAGGLHRSTGRRLGMVRSVRIVYDTRCQWVKNRFFFFCVFALSLSLETITTVILLWSTWRIPFSNTSHTHVYNIIFTSYIILFSLLYPRLIRDTLAPGHCIYFYLLSCNIFWSI